jgi:bacterioferritin-associated ferredoxin
MYICICHGVTDRQIHAAVSEGAATLEDVSFALGVGSGCGCCRESAQQEIERCRSCPNVHTRRHSAAAVAG